MCRHVRKDTWRHVAPSCFPPLRRPQGCGGGGARGRGGRKVGSLAALRGPLGGAACSGRPVRGTDHRVPPCSLPSCAQARGTGPRRSSTGSYPQAAALHRKLSTGLCPTSPRFGSRARCVAERPRHRPEPRCRPGFRASGGLLPCPHRPRDPIVSTGVGCFPVDNSTHSLFAMVRRECTRGRKIFSGKFGRVIHRRGPKSVDNHVDNLWTSAPGLWVTRGLPVDGAGGHGITRPQAPVENLGKTCGRACGRTVENLGTTRFIHRPPKLSTGSSTRPVDKNSGADLVKRGLSTVSTGPTTTAHLDQPKGGFETATRKICGQLAETAETHEPSAAAGESG